MSLSNYFVSAIACPRCQKRCEVPFEADIGVLDLSVFRLGDLVIRTIPPDGRPYGPDASVEWRSPFWAVGFGQCPLCRQLINARIVIRDRRFVEARPTSDALDVMAWGPLDNSAESKPPL